MRIAVRNIGGARYPGNRYRSSATHAGSWEALVATGADVVLAQEAILVDGVPVIPGGWRVGRGDRPGTSWGSVVAARYDLDLDLAWRPVHPVLDELGTYLDFAILRGGKEDVVLVSVHVSTAWSNGLWRVAGHEDSPPTGRTRPWPSNLVLETLVEVLDGRPAILAGDWNESPNWPSADDRDTAAWFQRAADVGLVEVLGLTFGGVVRTNFVRNTKRAYQNDHVFVTAGLVDRVRSVGVWHEPGSPLADHAGIWFEFS